MAEIIHKKVCEVLKSADGVKDHPMYDWLSEDIRSNIDTGVEKACKLKTAAALVTVDECMYSLPDDAKTLKTGMHQTDGLKKALEFAGGVIQLMWKQRR